MPHMLNTIGSEQGVRISTVQGFPYSRNKMKTREQKIRTHGLQFNTVDISDTFFPDAQYNKDMHIALECNKREVRDNNGGKISLPNMQGMSGGPSRSIVLPRMLRPTEYMPGEFKGFCWVARRQNEHSWGYATNISWRGSEQTLGASQNHDANCHLQPTQPKLCGTCMC